MPSKLDGSSPYFDMQQNTIVYLKQNKKLKMEVNNQDLCARCILSSLTLKYDLAK
jgi:hypothetical protein